MIYGVFVVWYVCFRCCFGFGVIVGKEIFVELCCSGGEREYMG